MPPEDPIIQRTISRLHVRTQVLLFVVLCCGVLVVLFPSILQLAR